jgi:hypothetical protein
MWLQVQRFAFEGLRRKAPMFFGTFMVSCVNHNRHRKDLEMLYTKMGLKHVLEKEHLR